MRHEYFGDGAPILTEFILSDMAVEGTTDKAGPQMDLDVSLLPMQILTAPITLA
jgi:hypothetical protein